MDALAVLLLCAGLIAGAFWLMRKLAESVLPADEDSAR